VPSGYALIDGRGVCTDEWDGYPAERRRVAGWLDERGGGALVLSGDVHSSWVFEGVATPDLPASVPELVCPPVSSTPMARQLPEPAMGVLDRAAAGVPGPRWFDLTSWGYLVLEITRATVTAEYRFVDVTIDEAVATAGPVFALDLHPPGRVRAVGPDPESADGREFETRAGSTQRSPVAVTAAVTAASVAVGVIVIAARHRLRRGRVRRRPSPR
jgi:hypothetical protein